MGANPVERHYINQAQAEMLKQRHWNIQTDNQGKFYYCTESAETAQEIQSLLNGQANTQNNTQNPIGTVVETTVQQDKNVVSKETTQSIKVDDLLNQFNIPADKQDAVKKDLASVTIGDVININEQTKKTIEDVINRYNKQNTQTFAEFPENTDPALIQYSIDKGYIEKQGDKYVVKKQDELNTFLTKEEKTVNNNEKVSLNTTSTTVTRKKALDVPEDIATSRKARNEYEKKLEGVIEKQVAEGRHSDEKFQIIASSRHEKEIAKREAKIQKECKGRPVEILKKFINSYASETEKNSINKLLDQVSKDDALLVAAWNHDAKTSGRRPVGSISELNEAQKETAKYLAMEGNKDFDSKTLVERMAVHDVMDKRSAKKIEKDDKWFIENQAKRITKKEVTNKEIENTVVHYSKADKKADGNDPNKKHTDIGKYGRKLVELSPKTFCEEVDANTWNENLGPKVTDANGKVHYFIFKQDKYNKYCAAVTNSSDPEKYAQDNNLTLNEARAEINRLGSLYDINGNEITIEEAVGNNNGKVGNGELNKFRHFIEAGGYSIDKNPTNAKRALHVLKNFGIGAGLGFLGGAGASVLGSFAETGMTAAQIVVSPGQTVTTNGYRIEDTVNFKFDGETFSKTIVHDIPPETLTTEDQELLVKGQEWSAGRKHLENGIGTGITGGLAGAGTGLLTMGKVHAKGNNNDWIINTDISTTEHSEDSLDLNITQPQNILTFSGNVQYGLEGFDNVVLKNRKLNQAQVEPNKEKLAANHIHSKYGQTTTAGDYKVPTEINSLDTTSLSGKGQHDYKFRLLTDAEVQEYKNKNQIPKDAEGPFYIKVSVTDRKDNNKDISNGEDIYKLTGKTTEIKDGTLSIKYNIEQFDGYLGAGRSAADKKTISRYW